jgi:NTE family protein
MLVRKKKASIGIALSGGTALSIAHIGVLTALERAGIEISCIAGTSGGAIVGACYAAGVSLEAIAESASTVSWRRMAGLQRPRLGVFSGENIAAFVSSQIGDITFADLKIPFRAVTVDLLTGEEIDIGEGSVGQAVRASCTIPGVFDPVRVEGRLLVDGGLANRIPVDVVARMGADLLIGSDVSYEARRERVPRNVLEVTLTALSFIAEERAKRNRDLADFMIYPRMEGISSLNLSKWRQAIQDGKDATTDMISSIQQEIKRRSQWWRPRSSRRRRAPQTG